MNYLSTREILPAPHSYPASAVILRGIASDGGLFVPESIPAVTPDELSELRGMDYPGRAALILAKFLGDYTRAELLEDCRAAYSSGKFPGGAAPVTAVTDQIHALELWHGPTAAFKDMALQVMPRLLSRALGKNGENRTALILVATSGDTGKAALEGYRDIDGVKILVFYPENGVSRAQKLQMITQEGGNVGVIAINGNFDDAQNGVKRIFGDADIIRQTDKAGYFLSSANSINFGRLAPQIAYYFSAYCDMINNGTIAEGERFDICVPTGNFGNILAAYIARRMGLPAARLICASNSNRVLADFLADGVYDRNRAFHTTMSPSMDILISSNLERLIYFIAGAEETVRCMDDLARHGRYAAGADTLAKINEIFTGGWCSEDQTAAAINRSLNNYGYLCDTHTAVGLHCAEDYIAATKSKKKMLIVSTANPYKFAADVYRAAAGHPPANDLSAPNQLLALTGAPIPKPLAGLAEKVVRFNEVLTPLRMGDAVIRFIG